MPKVITTDMTLKTFLKNSNIINKHPEIFNSTKSDDIKRLIGIFQDFTNILNKSLKKYTKNNKLDRTNEINKIIKNINNETLQEIEKQEWNEHYIKYNNKDCNNEMYIFPRNNGGGKIMTDFKFLVNCFPLRYSIPNSIQLVNRNDHMILAGEPVNKELENGVGLTFKILFLYNPRHNKWIVSPFKVVSETQNVDCSAFKICASNNDIEKQYRTWKYSLENAKGYTGLINIKFLDKKFKKLHNLFNPQQSNELIIKAKKIAMENIMAGGYISINKQSKKKQSVNKQS